MNEIINHKRGDCIWYHTTPMERWEKIRAEGLRINSAPTYQSEPEPWIYLSTQPFYFVEAEPFIILEVDLSPFETSQCGWPFVDESNWEERWQLRFFTDIPKECIKPMDIREAADQLEQQLWLGI